MQPGKLLIVALTVLLGTAAAASAISLHAPRRSGQPEQDLYPLIQAWGLTIDLDDLKHATPLETLPGGAYVIAHYASDLNMVQLMGVYSPRAPITRGTRSPNDATVLLTAWQSGNWTCNLAFSETSTFAFFDVIKKPASLMTTEKQNSAPGHHHACGSIYDLGEINPLYAGQYIIAFENDRIRRADGNPNYGLVVHVSSAPLPATLPLVASGLLGLLIFRWRRKHSPWPP